MELLANQREAIECMKHVLSENKGTLLRADVGTGKTIMAQVVAQGYERILWVAKAKDLADLEAKLHKQSRGLKLNPKEIRTISYHGFADRNKLSAKELAEYDLVIFDEAQMVAKASASWTRRLWKVNKPKMIFMTATPISQHPNEMLYLIRKCGVLDDFKDLKEVRMHFFGAKPSRFGDFLEIGELQNVTDFNARLNTIKVEVRHNKKDLPPVDIEGIVLDGEWTDMTSIQDATASRRDNGLKKVPQVAKYIRRLMRKTPTALIVTHFHEVANALGEELNITPSLDAKSLQKAFDCAKSEGGYIISTLGLCSSNYDFNECDYVWFAESSYSAAKDQQVIGRCYRIGKVNKLNVTYFHYKNEAPLIKMINSLGNLQSEVRPPSISPSKMASLEKCPGSFWLGKPNVDWVTKYSFMGSTVHSMIEDAVRHGGRSKYIPDYAYPCIEYFKELAKKCTWWKMEEWLNLNTIDERVRGKADFVSWDEDERTLYVIDYKNGRTKVDVKDNIQLLSYAAMACHTYGLAPETVVVGVYQRDKLTTLEILGEEIYKIRRRIEDIVDGVIIAEKAPLKYLNPENDCSPFCNCRSVRRA